MAAHMAARRGSSQAGPAMSGCNLQLLWQTLAHATCPLWAGSHPTPCHLPALPAQPMTSPAFLQPSCHLLPSPLSGPPSMAIQPEEEGVGRGAAAYLPWPFSTCPPLVWAYHTYNWLPAHRAPPRHSWHLCACTLPLALALAPLLCAGRRDGQSILLPIFAHLSRATPRTLVRARAHARLYLSKRSGKHTARGNLAASKSAPMAKTWHIATAA